MNNPLPLIFALLLTSHFPLRLTALYNRNGDNNTNETCDCSTECSTNKNKGGGSDPLREFFQR